MAITYTWDCRTVDVYPTASDAETPPVTETDVVYNVHWRLTGAETVNGVDYSATNIGTQVVSSDKLGYWFNGSSYDRISSSTIRWCCRSDSIADHSN